MPLSSNRTSSSSAAPSPPAQRHKRFGFCSCFVNHRCVLVSGLKADHFRAARSILEEEQDRLGVTPLVLLTPEIGGDRVGDVLTDAAEISSRQVSFVFVFGEWRGVRRPARSPSGPKMRKSIVRQFQ